MDTLMGCVGFPAIAPTEAARLVADKAGIKPGPTEQNAREGAKKPRREAGIGAKPGGIEAWRILTRPAGILRNRIPRRRVPTGHRTPVILTGGPVSKPTMGRCGADLGGGCGLKPRHPKGCSSSRIEHRSHLGLSSNRREPFFIWRRWMGYWELGFLLLGLSCGIQVGFMWAAWAR